MIFLQVKLSSEKMQVNASNFVVIRKTALDCIDDVATVNAIDKCEMHQLRGIKWHGVCVAPVV